MDLAKPDLGEAFLAFVDALEFKESSYPLLLETSNNVAGLRLGENPQVTTLYFNLFVMYCRVHILMARIKDVKVLLAYFSSIELMQASKDQIDPAFQRLVLYVALYENPIARIRKDMSSVVSVVGSALRSFLSTYMHCNNTDQLEQEGALSLIFSSEKGTEAPVQDQFHMELPLAAHMHDWVVFGFLTCPGVINEEVLFFLAKALNHGFVISVFRDQVLYTHAEFDALFDKNKFPNVAALPKYRKTITDTLAYSIMRSHKDHAKRRSYLRHQLKSLSLLLAEHPGLIAPKIQMVLSALALANGELDFYFRHVNRPPPKNLPAGVKHNPADWLDGNIAELIHYAFILQELVVQHKDLVSRYYMAYLKGTDYKAFKRAAENSGAAFGVDVQMGVLLKGMQDALKGLNDSDYTDPALDQVRQAWARILATLTSPSATVRPQNVQELVIRANLIVRHTRHVDLLEEELKRAGSLLWMWGYHTELRGIFTACLQGKGASATHAMTVIRLFTRFTFNATKYFPNELADIGQACVSSVDTMLKELSAAVTGLLWNLIGAKGWEPMVNQTMPVNAIFAYRKDVRIPDKPGAESNFLTRQKLSYLSTWQHRLWELASAFEGVDELFVFDQAFAPLEYLREALLTTLRTFIVRKSVQIVDGGNEVIERPSVLERSLRNFITALKSVEGFLPGLDVTYIVRQTMLQQFYDRNPAALSQVQTIPEQLAPDSIAQFSPHPKDEARVIGHMANWFVGFAFSDLVASAKTVAVYSTSTKGYVTLPLVQSPFRAENYLDLEEMKALARVVGPYGIRVIDNELLKRVVRTTKQLRETLMSNRGALDKFAKSYLDPQMGDMAEKALKGIDYSQLWDAITGIGNALIIRRLMRAGLKSVVEDKVPFIADVVESTVGQYPANVFFQKQFLGSDSLALDTGVVADVADPALKAALNVVTGGHSDEGIWNNLPYLFSLLVVASPTFGGLAQGVRYLPKLDAMTNNSHVTAYAMGQLMLHMTAITSAAAQPGMANHGSIVQTMQNFVQATSVQLLRASKPLPAGQKIKDPKVKERNEIIRASLPPMLVFLDRFASGVPSNYVHENTMSASLPYALLRTTYSDLYLKAGAGTA